MLNRVMANNKIVLALAALVFSYALAEPVGIHSPASAPMVPGEWQEELPEMRHNLRYHMKGYLLQDTANGQKQRRAQPKGEKDGGKKEGKKEKDGKTEKGKKDKKEKDEKKDAEKKEDERAERRRSENNRDGNKAGNNRDSSDENKRRERDSEDEDKRRERDSADDAKRRQGDSADEAKRRERDSSDDGNNRQSGNGGGNRQSTIAASESQNNPSQGTERKKLSQRIPKIPIIVGALALLGAGAAVATKKRGGFKKLGEKVAKMKAAAKLKAAARK